MPCLDLGSGLVVYFVIWLLTSFAPVDYVATILNVAKVAVLLTVLDTYLGTGYICKWESAEPEYV